jgi:hypothetical protein
MSFSDYNSFMVKYGTDDDIKLAHANTSEPYERASILHMK